MIIGFFGDPRQGKTLSAVNEIHQILKREPNRQVYSNTWLDIPFTPLTLKMALDAATGKYHFADDSILLVDEIYIWLDSRSSSSTVNKVLSYVLMQSGKMGKNCEVGMVFIYTAQYYTMVDKRVLAVTSATILCERWKAGEHTFIHQYRAIRHVNHAS